MARERAYLGQKDRLIGLESYTETKSALSGGVAQTWRSEGKAWARVLFNAGTESVDADQLQAVQTVTFQIGYRAGGLTTRYRVTFEGKVFDILSVTEVGRRQGLNLKAENRS